MNRHSVREEAKKESEIEAKQEAAESNVSEFNPQILSADLSKSSQEIFIDIGRQLRERREMLSLIIEEVERHIHVRAAFLRALERGA